jgi:hypothetical protein
MKNLRVNETHNYKLYERLRSVNFILLNFCSCTFGVLRVKGKKVKLSLFQAMEAHRVVRRQGAHIF